MNYNRSHIENKLEKVVNDNLVASELFGPKEDCKYASVADYLLE